MQEQISEIFIYIKGTFKRKWLAICLSWIICLVGWVIVMMLPNKYTSVAKVHVDSTTMLQPLLQDIAVQKDGHALVRVMKELMFTTPNLDKIIALSNLDLFVESNIQKVELYEEMRKDIWISGGQEDGLFEITYESDDPNTAKNVVSAVLTVFSEQTHQSTLDDVSSSQHFIERQIRGYEVRLRNAEQAREVFKRANFGLLPDDGSGGQMGKLHSTNEQLEDARLLLREAISKRNILAAQMKEVTRSGDVWSGTDSTFRLSAEDEKIAALRQKKIDLLLKYTSNHPAISSIEVTLAEALRRKEVKDKERASSGIPDAGVMSNPYVQQLIISLNGTEAEVASNRARVNVLVKRIEKYKNQLNSRLTVETDMQNLNRDYETIRENYQKLIERREQARISEQVDAEAVAIKFKISDPPNMPLTPSGPKRLILITVILFASIIIGFGLVFLLYYIQPTFLTTKQLREATGLPILGSVSMQVVGDISKKNFMFEFFLVALICVYFGLMGFEYMRIFY